MNDDLDPALGHREQMMRLNDLKTLVHHGRQIDRDFGPHAPIRMRHSLFGCHGRHLGQATCAERAARGGQHDATDPLMLLEVEDLEDRAVLQIDGQKRRAVAFHLFHHEIAGANQCLFVGKGDHRAAPHRGQGRFEPRRSDDRRHDDFRRPVRCFYHSLRSGSRVDM